MSTGVGASVGIGASVGASVGTGASVGASVGSAGVVQVTSISAPVLVLKSKLDRSMRILMVVPGVRPVILRLVEPL